MDMVEPRARSPVGPAADGKHSVEQTVPAVRPSLQALSLPARLAPAVGLFVLAPLIAEFLLGNIAIDAIAALLVLAPLYGGGALLAYAWHAFPQPPVVGSRGRIDLLGNVVFAAGAVLLLAAAIAAQRRDLRTRSRFESAANHAGGSERAGDRAVQPSSRLKADA